MTLHAMTLTVYREVNEDRERPLPIEAAILVAAQQAAGRYADIKLGRPLTPLTLAEIMALLPLPGTRVMFQRNVDRWPHARVLAGETGTFTAFDGQSAWVRLDRHDDGLDEWDNCIQWYEDDLASILTDIAPLP